MHYSGRWNSLVRFPHSGRRHRTCRRHRTPVPVKIFVRSHFKTTAHLCGDTPNYGRRFSAVLDMWNWGRVLLVRYHRVSVLPGRSRGDQGYSQQDTSVLSLRPADTSTTPHHEVAWLVAAFFVLSRRKLTGDADVCLTRGNLWFCERCIECSNQHNTRTCLPPNSEGRNAFRKHALVHRDCASPTSGRRVSHSCGKSGMLLSQMCPWYVQARYRGSSGSWRP